MHWDTSFQEDSSFIILLFNRNFFVALEIETVCVTVFSLYFRALFDPVVWQCYQRSKCFFLWSLLQDFIMYRRNWHLVWKPRVQCYCNPNLNCLMKKIPSYLLQKIILKCSFWKRIFAIIRHFLWCSAKSVTVLTCL